MNIGLEQAISNAPEKQKNIRRWDFHCSDGFSPVHKQR